jgi:predicted ATPase
VFPHWRAQGAIYRGWAKVENGDFMDGMLLLRSGLTAYRSGGAELLVPHYMALLTAACEIAGHAEESPILLDDTLRVIERTGERWFAAELNRHKGKLLLRQGYFDAAEELYLKALSIAEEQGAKLWELRAALNLARLRREQNRGTEARAALAPVCAWFTESFDTPEFKEAKALLDELA